MAMWTPERELMGILVEEMLEADSRLEGHLRMPLERRRRIEELWKHVSETGERRDKAHAEMHEKAEKLRNHGLETD